MRELATSTESEMKFSPSANQLISSQLPSLDSEEGMTSLYCHPKWEGHTATNTAVHKDLKGTLTRRQVQ